MKNFLNIFLPLIFIVSHVLTSSCPTIICREKNEASENGCFYYDKIKADIEMYPSECQCKILLNKIIDESGTFDKKGIDYYKKCY